MSDETNQAVSDQQTASDEDQPSGGYTLWAPTKAEDQYDDDEIKKTTIFKRLKQNTNVSMGNATVPLKDATLISITRDTIKEMWNTLQLTRYSSKGNAFFEALEDDGIDHGNEVTLIRDDNGIVHFKLAKGSGTRRRFSHDNYRHFIGKGTPEDSETYRESVKLLQEKCGLDASALHGGFLLNKTQMRSDSKNGVFELVLETGKEGNRNTDKFSAKLYQFPFVKQAIPTIVFPPVSGEKGKDATLQVTDIEQEVGSMSNMLKAAIIKGAQTPAVVFGLVDLLKKEKPGSEADNSKIEEGNEASPTAVAAAPAPAPVSAAHALLDDDEEEE